MMTKRVPREPTEAMLDAPLPDGNAWTASAIWRAMYDAAPAADVSPTAGASHPAPPSPDDVRRFACYTQEDGAYESQTGEHVAYADYANLAAALRRERERAERAEALAALRLEWYARACAERDALRADAERYRWLRARLYSVDFAYGDEAKSVLVFEAPSAPLGPGGALDAAIDADMRDARRP